METTFEIKGKNGKKDREITFEIVENIVTLSDNGLTFKALNRVSYNEAAPKYDLRSWKRTEAGLRPLKGVTMNEEEMETLRDAIKDRAI